MTFAAGVRVLAGDLSSARPDQEGPPVRRHRVPTRSVRKYTVGARLEPSGAH